MFKIRLKELREARGLSQYGFAAEIGYPQSTIAGWESGSRETNFATLQKLADFFGVSVDYLLGRTNDKEIIASGSAATFDVNRLNDIRKAKGMTFEQLSEKSGVPQSTLYDIFRGIRLYPRIDTMRAIERALGIGEYADDIMPAAQTETRRSPIARDIVELNDQWSIPILGEVVAGVPIASQENIEGYIFISYKPHEEYFALRVHGDSMRDVGIFDGSIAVCHKQETAENGEIVVAMLNGEQTIKRFSVHGGNVFLMPANTDFMPIPVTPADDFLILGKVVEVRVAF